MSSKLKNDASSSIDGTIYQFYIAIDKCFELLEGEKIILEKYGDVTVSDKYQIEVKQYQEDLTDLHKNIWNTINNWLQNTFDISHYKNLILLTTQKFGVKSSFKEWNNKKKYEKKQILDDIALKFHQQGKKSEDTEKLLNSVLDSNKKERLLDILDKFIILDSSTKDSSYYEQIKQRHGKGVLSSNADDYINSIMGFLLSPKVRIGKSWEITYQDFTSKVESLVNQSPKFFRNGLLHGMANDEEKNIVWKLKVDENE